MGGGAEEGDEHKTDRDRRNLLGVEENLFFFLCLLSFLGGGCRPCGQDPPAAFFLYLYILARKDRRNVVGQNEGSSS